MPQLSRRCFLASAASVPLVSLASRQPVAEPIIDIHQHTGYKGRTTAQLVSHQREMGVTTTVILPSARAFDRLKDGSRKDAERATLGGNRAAAELVAKRGQEFVRFSNELPSLPEGLKTIETYLDNGGLGIGESKFTIPCDSAPIEQLAEIAQSFDVPVLLHFQHGVYNTGIERFYRILQKFPKVNFIGHAQTWWGNIDRNHRQEVMYPKGKVTPGGITDRLLSEYPNIFGDLSAGSGNNALTRDEAHARRFLDRHRDKLMFGSDCADTFGKGTKCTGARTIAAVRKLAADNTAERRILYHNAKKLLKLG